MLAVAQRWVGAGHPGPGIPTRCGAFCNTVPMAPAAPFGQTGGDSCWHQCPGKAEVWPAAPILLSCSG